MPKRAPDVVYIHRIELQEKEREALDAWIAGKTLKNVGVAAAGASVPVLGFLAYKAFKAWDGQEEGTIFDIFTNEGRDKIQENIKEDGFWSSFKATLFDPLGINPLI
jgi:hypothetical protein